MEVPFAYRGRSGLVSGASGDSLCFAANLKRDKVAFAGDLKNPLRFRELFSALHDVVISELRFQPKDHTAYKAWEAEQESQQRLLYQQALKQATEAIRTRTAQPMPANLESQFRKQHRLYWDARRAWSNKLMREDSALWARLRPCDPVVTVADDQVLFECFSKDESSYGALGVDRDAFATGSDAAYGTTNVDYSWELYEHIQGLRTYHATRFAVAPEGVALQVGEAPAYREEKIDLPQSWLRGFAQISAAAMLPAIKVPVTRDALYAILAWLRRHREKTGPRALRIELLSGKPVRIVLEPWEQVIILPDQIWRGPDLAPIRIWGRRRLLVLARVLPFVDHAEWHLLGTGLPWFVVLRCGEMRFTLGLSGWTTNDWTRSAALDLMASPAVPEEREIRQIADLLHRQRSCTLADLKPVINEPARLGACLTHLAGTGQIVHDLACDRYRWRQVMSRALGETEKGPDHPELIASRQILRDRAVKKLAASDQGTSGILLTAVVEGHDCEVLLSRDGQLRRAKCGCSWFRRGGLRQGPCRHILAARMANQQERDGLSSAVWTMW
jgi:SWIM zinc finger